MKSKLTCVNRKGPSYFLREMDGKRSKRMVCSKQEMVNDREHPDDFKCISL